MALGCSYFDLEPGILTWNFDLDWGAWVFPAGLGLGFEFGLGLGSQPRPGPDLGNRILDWHLNLDSDPP